MLGIDGPELLIILIVAVIAIGPKDLPVAMRTMGRWIGQMRRMSGHFRAGVDAMVREAEMEDMEKKWKAQNEKVMRDYPNGGPVEMTKTGAYPPHLLDEEKRAAKIAAAEAAASKGVAMNTAEPPVTAPADPAPTAEAAVTLTKS